MVGDDRRWHLLRGYPQHGQGKCAFSVTRWLTVALHTPPERLCAAGTAGILPPVVGRHRQGPGRDRVERPQDAGRGLAISLLLRCGGAAQYISRLGLPGWPFKISRPCPFFTATPCSTTPLFFLPLHNCEGAHGYGRHGCQRREESPTLTAPAVRIAVETVAPESTAEVWQRERRISRRMDKGVVALKQHVDVGGSRFIAHGCVIAGDTRSNRNRRFDFVKGNLRRTLGLLARLVTHKVLRDPRTRELAHQ